jgi:hypothetical protein
LARKVVRDDFDLVHWRSAFNAEARRARRFSFCFSLRPLRLCVLRAWSRI